MVDSLLKEQILGELGRLGSEQQKQVLDFARRLPLSTPLGVPGSRLLRFAGAIAADDLQVMAQAIEEECEKVNLHEW